MSMLPSGAALAASCAYSGENGGLQMRVLQTELMVAALTCNQKDKYNSFVRKFSSELVGQTNSMKNYFTRAHGSRATQEMNSLVTNLANEASQRVIKYEGNFCSDASALFDAVLAVSPKELVSFAAARPHANSHGIQICQIAAKQPGSPGS